MGIADPDRCAQHWRQQTILVRTILCQAMRFFLEGSVATSALKSRDPEPSTQGVVIFVVDGFGASIAFWDLARLTKEGP